MSEKDNTAHDMSRRNVLLATTSIAAVSALGAAASVEKELAQAQPAPSTQFVKFSLEKRILMAPQANPVRGPLGFRLIHSQAATST